MALFQEKILKKFLVSDEIVSEKFQNYLKYKAKAEEIKNFKEEEFQDGFLRDIFENCLGFTLKSTNPKNFNLEREKKNEKDSKKADGAILIDGKVIGIIELKSYKSKNLDEVARQAFWYLSQNSNAHFVVISNFDELRFYINKATNYEKFKLFSLDFEEFKKLYTILSFESIKQNLPLKMQNESQEFEQNITKEFYKIFSKFRNELFENLLKNNDESDKIELLNASSKLCDRFIFMLFAKDRNLLPNDIFRQILEEFQNQKFTDFSLYEMFKIYFQAINSGNEKLGIQAYNGGLFAADEVLNELKIDDEILKNNLEKLNSYDFESEISVNILGHIFEQSLSDLEEIESKLNAENFDKTTSKRKKDGVFYTPNFITTFIVENSLGKLCEDKKEEFNLNEILENLKENKEKLTKIEGKKGKIASDERKILELKQEENLQILEKYKTWLLNLKIIDPACGSGAFLNEALEFLIKEHENLKAEMANAGNLFYGENIDISILENNLFGVDINSQAVEIAKLSLWLRTAKKGRKLTKLSDNLKAANSLLEMPFQAASFDIVLGNPPYVKENTNKNAFDALRESQYYQGKMDLWYFFACQALDIVKENGLISFIAPSNWISNAGASKMRNKILEDGKILEFIDFGAYKVFEDAGIQTMIYIMQKSKNNLSYNLEISKILDKNLSQDEFSSFLKKIPNEKFAFFTSKIDKNKMLNQIINFSEQKIENLLTKISTFKNFSLNGKGEIFSGIDFPQDFVNKKSQEILGKAFKIGDGIFVISNSEKEALNLTQNELSLLKPFYTTKELKEYWGDKENKFWLIYTNSSFKNPNSLASYPNIKKHLDKFQSVITSENKPYGLNRAREENNFLEEKIIVRRKAPNKPTFTFVDFPCFFNRTFMIIKSKRINLKYLTALLNSKLFAFWLKNKGKMQGEIFQVDKEPLLTLPIFQAEESKQEFFITLVDEILTSKEKIKDYKILLAETIENNNFDREIALKKEIEKLEKLCAKNELKIDKEVYSLYELNEEEIAIVENS